MYLRALQGHSGRSLIDPTLQDNVLIGPGIFSYIYHVGCTFNLHSIINNGLVPGGQNSSRRQTVFFLPVDPRNESHRDPEYIDFSVPRLARYMHKAWKRHQDVVFWVDIDLAIKEGLVFYQTRSNALILQGTLPAYCITKVERLKTGKVLYERPYLSPRPPPKISLRHDHDWTRGNEELGSTVEQHPVGKLVQQSFAINLRSIISSGLIPGGQHLSNVDPMDKNHKDPDTIDLNAPRLAQCMHKAWKRHQNTVSWVDINLALKKGLKFYQNSIERYHSSRNTPSFLYSESCSDGNWRSLLRESFCVTSSSSKDFLET